MILGSSRSVRVFAYPEAVDLRKGYNGLYGLVKAGLGRDPPRSSRDSTRRMPMSPSSSGGSTIETRLNQPLGACP